MTKQSIGLGSALNDGTGDPIRTGGDKINDNFDEIYTLLGDGTTLTSGLSATTSVVTLAAPTITSVASFAAGSASAPSITKTGDTDTGIFFSAANEVAITTGGTQRLKVDNSCWQRSNSRCWNNRFCIRHRCHGNFFCWSCFLYSKHFSGGW